MKHTISFIGSVGIPNRYGGFESFLENVSPEVAKTVRTIVTCEAARYPERQKIVNNVECVFIPVKANGPLSTIHDFVAFCAVLFRSDAICVLGVSAGPFFLAMRVLASLFRKRLVVNIDGIEWRRTKFSPKVRLVLRIFDALAQLAAHRIIIDSPALAHYVLSPFKKKAHYVPYSGDHVERPAKGGINRPPYGLTICRIEPENNLETNIAGFLQSTLSQYVIIGNWEHSAFSKKLRQKYASEPRLVFLDPIYNTHTLAEYRENCSIYLHGHSVGGTNPSLVEMLFYDCPILCFDCSFNRITASNQANYYASAHELSQRINDVLSNPTQRNQPESLAQFTKQRIAEQYIEHCVG